MKKNIILFALAIFNCISINAAFYADDGGSLLYEFDEIYTYDSANVYVTAGIGTIYFGDIVIPDSIEYSEKDVTGAFVKKHKLCVVGIGEYAFNNTDITSVTLPNTILFIGDYAFANCHELKEIELPENLGQIGSYAFNACVGIKNFIIPSSVYYIYPYAFGGDYNSATGTVEKSKLESILFETEQRFDINDETFGNIDSTKVVLYVRQSIIETVKLNPAYYMHFKAIYQFDNGTITLQEKTANSITFTWFAVEDAVSYNLKVKVGNTVFKEYNIDASGNIISYKKPAATEMKMDTTNSTTQMCMISIDGLTPNTEYNYEIVGEDKSANVVYNKSGKFMLNDQGGITHTPTDYNQQSSQVEDIIESNCCVDVYTINGTQIKSGVNLSTTQLPKGIYIIRANNYTKKLLVQ